MAGLENEVFALRLGRANANQGGELQVSLIWNDIADLDLHCETPAGEHIYFGHKETDDGGWLDVDMNAGYPLTLEPVENIFWHSSPSGHYKFYVNFFNCHCDATHTDPNRKVQFKCLLKRNGTAEWFNGVIGPHENVTCFEFDHVGSGAVGSFVVMPPSDEKTTFAESCRKHGVTYTAGQGYYAVARPEKIQAYKHMLLHDTTNDTFLIGADACRKALGWPAGELKKGPKDIKAGFRLFVQSTSHNRVIPPGTHVLVKVPMKEALARRVAGGATFAGESQSVGTGGAAAAPAQPAPKKGGRKKKAAEPEEEPEEAEAEAEAEPEEEEEEEEEKPKRGRGKKPAAAKPAKAKASKKAPASKKGGTKRKRGEDPEEEEAEGGDEGAGGDGLAGMTFCITGKFSKPRTAIEKEIVLAGGSVSGTVSKKVTHLLCEGDEGSSKYAKAESMGIPIHDEAWLRQQLSGADGPAKKKKKR